MTVKMASAALLLLALSVLTAEAHAQAKNIHMFKDWMDAKNGKTVKTASYYEESELQGACLRALTYQKCAETGKQIAHTYFETDVGCCTEGYHKHQDTFRLPDDLKVGRCFWTTDRTVYPGDPSYVTTDMGVTLEGTFEMTCELEADAEKCGEPLCDDLVLKGWGQTYLDPNAAIEGKPLVVEDDDCDNFWEDRKAARAGTAPKQPAQQPAQQSAPTKNTPVKIASADYYYKDEPETQYYLGRARVFTGYVQVMSCSKKVVYKEGKMQAIGDYYIYDETTPIKPSLDQFIAKPYTVDFILRKSGDY